MSRKRTGIQLLIKNICNEREKSSSMVVYEKTSAFALFNFYLRLRNKRNIVFTDSETKTSAV